MKPNLSEEKKLWKRGFKYVVGLDEAGRGPLAGPVVAAAVCVSNFDIRISSLRLRDSKKLSAAQRDKFYKVLTSHKNIEWGIGIVSEKVIDKMNIFEATRLAMAKALRQAQGKLKNEIDFLILDGNFKINSRIPQRPVIRGYQKVFSCAAASIIAKVRRDRIMEKYDKKHPGYGFKKHKGYPTKAHFASLQKFGPCKIHRKTFWPVCRGN